MNQTDLKFFTNEPERDLYSRFAAILKSNTQFFDILVGYFRSSGFFKMYEALESVEKIRILVGLNVDKFTVKVIDRATNEARVSSISEKEGKEIIVVIWQHQEWKARGGIEMGFKICFSAGVDNDYDDYKVQPELKQPAAPRKSLVEVFFSGRNMTLTYYNNQFDLHSGDMVYVDGKLEGLLGRVVEVTYFSENLLRFGDLFVSYTRGFVQ